MTSLRVDQTGHFQTHHTTILKYVEHKDFYPTGLLNLKQKYVYFHIQLLCRYLILKHRLKYIER